LLPGPVRPLGSQLDFYNNDTGYLSRCRHKLLATSKITTRTTICPVSSRSLLWQPKKYTIYIWTYTRRTMGIEKGRTVAKVGKKMYVYRDIKVSVTNKKTMN